LSAIETVWTEKGDNSDTTKTVKQTLTGKNMS